METVKCGLPVDIVNEWPWKYLHIVYCEINLILVVQMILAEPIHVQALVFELNTQSFTKYV